MNTNTLGTLYIVATPIGNLQDITLRAIDILKTVDCIAAEDTRHSASLLRQFAISTPIIALHEHNERERAASLLDRLSQGQSMALISDAGTPLISDPGFFLVRSARELGVRIVPVPGACAAIAALSVAGLPTDRFIFEGFLPAKTKARFDRLQALQSEVRTLIFYESPHRILDCLQAMQEVFGAMRQVVIARELTKTFETIRAGSLVDLIEWTNQDTNQQRGEFVVLVEGNVNSAITESFSAEHVLSVLLADLPVKQAVDLAVKITGEKKNFLYEMALQLKK